MKNSKNSLNDTRKKEYDDGNTNQFLDEKNLYSKQYASIFLMQMSIIKIIKRFCKFFARRNSRNNTRKNNKPKKKMFIH